MMKDLTENRLAMDSGTFCEHACARNRIYGATTRDKINDMASSDMLGNFAGSANIWGGDGNDLINSSADIQSNRESYRETDCFQNWGLPDVKKIQNDSYLNPAIRSIAVCVLCQCTAGQSNDEKLKRRFPSRTRRGQGQFGGRTYAMRFIADYLDFHWVRWRFNLKISPKTVVLHVIAKVSPAEQCLLGLIS